ncbi:MAG TPA: glycosyltransferase family 4 protein [Acidimicrobiales bacterium]|nr:glycosyltransferase family 4 protein [Acidimicrobiales bacterium]
MTSSDHASNIAKLGDIAASAGLRRIHLVSWRDLDDVEAGGSEVHAATVSRLWAEAGIEVLLRTSYAQGHPPRVRRDGYDVVRKAGRYMVFPRAAITEAVGRYGKADGLVEIWNGMPFFSPLWARGPRIVFLHHVHAEMWQMVLPPRLAAIGDTIECRIAPLLYRRSRIVTLSESSKRELVDDLGYHDDRVTVVPPGVEPAFTMGDEARSPHPLVVAAGRLVPVKRYDLLIEALVELKARQPALEAVIVGEGYERIDLERRIAAHDAGSWLHLPGRLPLEELISLYRRAWVLTSASAREGWGMTITEAAACGTPAVVTDINGHADAVVADRSGLLVDGRDGLVSGLDRVLSDDTLRARLSEGARAHAAPLTWEATALGTLQALADEANRRRRR